MDLLHVGEAFPLDSLLTGLGTFDLINSVLDLDGTFRLDSLLTGLGGLDFINDPPDLDGAFFWTTCSLVLAPLTSSITTLSCCGPCLQCLPTHFFCIVAFPFAIALAFAAGFF